MAIRSEMLDRERMILAHFPRLSDTATEIERTTASELALEDLVAAAKAARTTIPISPKLELESDTSSATVRVDSINLILESIYQDVASTHSRQAVKRIFKHFNWLLANEKFAEVDDFLSRVQPGLLDLDTALAFMTITFAARDKLAERHSLYELILDRISAVAGSDKAERLLTCLR